MTLPVNRPADGVVQAEFAQVEDAIDRVANFFNDYPGSLPDQEEDIEDIARHALGLLTEFIADRWGS